MCEARFAVMAVSVDQSWNYCLAASIDGVTGRGFGSGFIYACYAAITNSNGSVMGRSCGDDLSINYDGIE
jgi:hypothetical protein